jgi:hypothetical protein
MGALVKAVKAGGSLLRLRTLRLSGAGMEPSDLHALTFAMGVSHPSRGAALRDLLLDGNPRVGPLGVLSLAAVVRDGGFPNLEWLSLGGAKVRAWVGS